MKITYFNEGVRSMDSICPKHSKYYENASDPFVTTI